MAVELVAPVVVAPVVAAGATSCAMRELLVVWMTCVVDGREHAVTDDRACAGLERGLGIYDAVCGASIAPQAMTSAPGPRCAGCCRLLDAWLRPPRRVGWWRRWLRLGGERRG